MRTLAHDLTEKSGKVQVSGWVNSRRDHGGLIFIDLRDHTGIIQLVIDPKSKEAFELAENLRDEYVISATGTIRKRGAGLENPNIPTGKIELVVEELRLLNRSEPLPVPTHDEGANVGEELRLKYKYAHDLIGKTIPVEVIKEIVTSLDMKITAESESGISLSVPAYRVDVQRPCDVVEDILRIYGYNPL